MEVMIQSPNTSPTKDTFNFNISGTMSSPYLSAPSSPKRFGEYYLSAPTSPSRISQLYSELEYFADSTIQEPIINNNNNNNVDDNDNDVDVDVDVDDGFAFFVGRELDNNKYSSRSAEELFHGGKIKPMKPEIENESNEQKKQEKHKPRTEARRGREREVLSSANSGRRVTRSLSPYRKTNNTWDLEEQNLQQQQQQRQPRSDKEETTLTSTNTKSSSKRWSLNLKDFLLFRSASEGRGSSKDPLKKFVGYKKGSIEEVKGSSFRSSDNTRKKGPVSAHEFHYAMKKAESQDMKKRTFLPYRQGILGRLSGFGL